MDYVSVDFLTSTSDPYNQYVRRLNINDISSLLSANATFEDQGVDILTIKVTAGTETSAPSLNGYATSIGSIHKIYYSSSDTSPVFVGVVSQAPTYITDSSGNLVWCYTFHSLLEILRNDTLGGFGVSDDYTSLKAGGSDITGPYGSLDLGLGYMRSALEAYVYQCIVAFIKSSTELSTDETPEYGADNLTSETRYYLNRFTKNILKSGSVNMIDLSISAIQSDNYSGNGVQHGSAGKEARIELTMYDVLRSFLKKRPRCVFSFEHPNCRFKIGYPDASVSSSGVVSGNVKQLQFGTGTTYDKVVSISSGKVRTDLLPAAIKVLADSDTPYVYLGASQSSSDLYRPFVVNPAGVTYKFRANKEYGYNGSQGVSKNSAADYYEYTVTAANPKTDPVIFIPDFAPALNSLSIAVTSDKNVKYIVSGEVPTEFISIGDEAFVTDIKLSITKGYVKNLKENCTEHRESFKEYWNNAYNPDAEGYIGENVKAGDRFKYIWDTLKTYQDSSSLYGLALAYFVNSGVETDTSYYRTFYITGTPVVLPSTSTDVSGVEIATVDNSVKVSLLNVYRREIMALSNDLIAYTPDDSIIKATSLSANKYLFGSLVGDTAILKNSSGTILNSPAIPDGISIDLPTRYTFYTSRSFCRKLKAIRKITADLITGEYTLYTGSRDILGENERIMIRSLKNRNILYGNSAPNYTSVNISAKDFVVSGVSTTGLKTPGFLDVFDNGEKTVMRGGTINILNGPNDKPVSKVVPDSPSSDVDIDDPDDIEAYEAELTAAEEEGREPSYSIYPQWVIGVPAKMTISYDTTISYDISQIVPLSNEKDHGDKDEDDYPD